MTTDTDVAKQQVAKNPQAEPQGMSPSLQNSSQLDIKKYIVRLSREPFQNILADIIGAQPTPERLLAFANESPDKWSSMIKTFAGLAGYKDEIEITNNFVFQLQNMSDAELMYELESIGPVLDLDPDRADDVVEAVAIEERE